MSELMTKVKESDVDQRNAKRTRIEELIHEELERPSSHSSHFDNGDEKAVKKPQEKRITDLLAENLREQLILKGYSVPVSGNGSRPTERFDSATETTEPMEGDLPKLSLHPSFFVSGVKIGWPFPVVMKPQRQMAMHLITALKASKHVVIESPTGTGKSAAILCSVLAWHRYHTKMEGASIERPCRIFYCSRTHSQVAQMVSSLRKTPYRPRMAMLGSRKLLCINQRVLDSKNMDKECRVRVKTTEDMRKYMLTSRHEYYDDNNPPKPSWEDSTEQAPPATPTSADAHDPDDDEHNDGMLRRLPKKSCCPHYQQIGTRRTAVMACNSFVPTRAAKNGGADSKHGTHDVEDLVLFGKDPYRQRGVAIYRSPQEPFGMTLIEDENRIRIGAIRNPSPAASSAAVKVGDVILTINGKAAAPSVHQAARQVGQTPDDKPLMLDTTSNPDHVVDDTEEDLSEHAPCPYYLSKGLAKDAELVFCPYNYVLDPNIREMSGINLRNSIVVLDEAHNVEDILRESGSGTFSEFELAEMVKMLYEYASVKPTFRSSPEAAQLSDCAHTILLVVESLLRCLSDNKVKFERSKATQVLQQWRNGQINDDKDFDMTFDGPTGHGVRGKAVGCATFLEKLDTDFDGDQLQSSSAEFVKSLRGEEDWQTDKFSGILDKLSSLTTILSLTAKHSEHYYIASAIKANGSLEFASRDETEDDTSPVQPTDKFRCLPKITSTCVCTRPECRATFCSRTGKLTYIRHGQYCDGAQPRWEALLRFELLTPAPLFADLRHQCRTVVLASGSLAPIPSLCAELGLLGSTATKEESLLSSGLLGTPANESEQGKETKEFPHSQNSQQPLDVSEAERVFDWEEQLLSPPCGVITPVPRLQMAPKPLEADHVIDLEKQLLVVSCGVLMDGSPLTANYCTWNQDSFVRNLGDAIATVVQSIPSGGVLVFFSSYSNLRKCVTTWQARQGADGWQARQRSGARSTVWERLVASKGKVVVEPTGSQADFELAREEYARTISATGSCVLLAVFRGKMSEGISFNDENARGVICVGIPFPSAYSRPITAKKAYNDEQRKLNKRLDLLPGNDWYAQQAYRAIAQALGRCIRHASDYGTIVLMDSRHCDDGGPREGHLCQAHLRLPKWMRHHVRNLSMRDNGDTRTHSIYGGWAGLQKEMKRFFTEAPVHAQKVREEEAMLLRNSQAQTSRSHRFDVKTGSWTSTAPIALDVTQEEELGVSDDDNSQAKVRSVVTPQTPMGCHSPDSSTHGSEEVQTVTRQILIDETEVPCVQSMSPTPAVLLNASVTPNSHE